MVEAYPGSWCDPCIAPIVRALNEGNIATVASCCGHGYQPANIALADGREVFVADAEWAEAIWAAIAVKREADLERAYVEDHAGPEKPDCIGQWCCGCTEHPAGKPWGWNAARWAEHYRERHGG